MAALDLQPSSRNAHSCNKRELSTAIALVGEPDFIILDEPSTGMDPKVRSLKYENVELVLTSHSQGYTLIARMKTVETQPGVSEETAPVWTQPLVNFITSTLPNTHVFNDHQGYVHFQVPHSSVSLAQVFTVMEQAKVQFYVEDYSVHQTTLEQVFLSFTRWQVPPKEDKTSCCKRICCC
ncbi:phospholipid-transporting ATPase ABCA3-like [Haliotis asinina]|uniref:phospholipid-transporting ATPase ABCA3-like n=1 Tax=Haliotis asinina TaxID=109174 RepID=UPI003531BE3C